MALSPQVHRALVLIAILVGALGPWLLPELAAPLQFIGLTAAFALALTLPIAAAAPTSDPYDFAALGRTDHRPAPPVDDARERAAHHVITQQFDLYEARAEAVADETAIMLAGIPSLCPEYVAAMAEAQHIATVCDANVLFTGKTGAGKNEALRRFGKARVAAGRARGDVEIVNCALLRDDPHLTALVGYKKGAFTGATHDHEGLLAKTHGGTLAFDELGELAPTQQAQLLRIIETKRYRPFGSTEEYTTDVGLVFATHRDLDAMVDDGLFREDLLARIDTFRIRLPSLVERRADMPATLDFALAACSADLGRVITLTPEARTRFLERAQARNATWPDNFRGFTKAVYRLAVRACTVERGGVIDVGMVDAEFEALVARWNQRRKRKGDLLVGLIAPDVLAKMQHQERDGLTNMVRICRENTSLAAASRELYSSDEETVSDPSRLRRQLEKYGLTFEAIRAA